ncbi:hypothetical protein ZIOFF_046530 [Zingiber officinale]|uniref:Uncharacterized protein n=1 Tax=Zingiber officinale TaxID=94328 RepID=A0A8J5KUT7_ZINOF|nr:hypothetical protein ZIOFF_046530 [Zingiber officinale]
MLRSASGRPFFPSHHILRRLLAAAPSPTPPPEWIDPFLDVSGVTCHPADPNHPSPWLSRVAPLVVASSPANLSSDLNAFCHKYIIRLTPAFKKYPGHELDSYVSLIDILSSSSDTKETSRIKELVVKIRDRGLPTSTSATTSLVRRLGSVGMVEELLWVWRSGKSCRLRWVNYLHPGLKHGPLTSHEQRLVIQLHAKWGNRWSRIALCLPGRTDNEIKNYWRTHTRKKAEELRMTSPSSLSSQSSSSNSEVVGQGPVVDGDGDGDGYSMDQIWDEISASENSRMLEECSESVLWELDDEECLQIWI